MGVDAWGFDAERQVAARRLRSKRLVLRAIHGAVIGLLATALVAGGAASLRDSVLRLRWPGWASAGAFLSLLFGAFAAAELPFAYVGGFRWERAFGLSRQRLSGWLKDVAKSLALGLVSTLVVGGALLWLLAATHWWWLVAWILGVAPRLESDSSRRSCSCRCSTVSGRFRTRASGIGSHSSRRARASL